MRMKISIEKLVVNSKKYNYTNSNITIENNVIDNDIITDPPPTFMSFKLPVDTYKTFPRYLFNQDKWSSFENSPRGSRGRISESGGEFTIWNWMGIPKEEDQLI